MERFDRLLIGLIKGVAKLAGLALLLGGLAGFAWQLYILAKHGLWQPFSLADGLYEIFHTAWLAHPTDWLGIHAALSWLSGPFVAIVAGPLLLFLSLLPDQ